MEVVQISAKDKRPDGIGYRIAQLGLWLNAAANEVSLMIPPAHTKFKEEPSSFNKNDLIIQVNDVSSVKPITYPKQLFKSKARGLWLDERGNYVLDSLMHTPTLRIVIQPDFSKGEAFGNYSITYDKAVFPLLYVDMIIFANWLAEFNDIILHAAGVKLAGRGYCFAGSSGSGKSTLAAYLNSNPNIKVLGEDQVVLRYLDGQFWIFGTPWHENPEMCSPDCAPLEKIIFLNRTGSFTIEPIQATDGIARILQTAFIPFYRTDKLPGILERLSLLAEHIPFFSLDYALGDNVEQLIFGS